MICHEIKFKTWKAHLFVGISALALFSCSGEPTYYDKISENSTIRIDSSAANCAFFRKSQACDIGQFSAYPYRYEGDGISLATSTLVPINIHIYDQSDSSNIYNSEMFVFPNNSEIDSTDHHLSRVEGVASTFQDGTVTLLDTVIGEVKSQTPFDSLLTTDIAITLEYHIQKKSGESLRFTRISYIHFYQFKEEPLPFIYGFRPRPNFLKAGLG